MRQGCPLDGVTVIDVSTSYAGPTATMLLADMGATVIKVERPGVGDDARHWGPPFTNGSSAWFLSANRNKLSVSIDLKHPQGQAVIRRLVESSDVFVESMNLAKLETLGISPTALRSINPKLVYCALSGFGMDGPDSDLPGYDLIAQARSGLMSVTGEDGGTPQRVSTALSDIATGFVAAFSIAAALRRQVLEGEGSTIDVSLLDVDLALMSPRIAAYSAGEPEPQPSGATDSVLAIYQQFSTADRPIVLAIGNDTIWRRFCTTVGLDDLVEDERFSTNAGRREHRDYLVDRISEELKAQPSDHWTATLGAAGVPCSPIQFLSDVTSDAHIAARGSLLSVQAGSDHDVTAAASPWSIDGQRNEKVSPPPSLARDNRTVLQDVGYTETQIDELVREGAIWEPTKQ